MTHHAHGSAGIEFPSDLEIVLHREFKAPIQLVFDVLTKAEHIRKTFAPYEEQVTVCDLDFRVGGDYHIVMVTPDGVECSFRGTYLEIDPPRHTAQTWHFDGWPDAWADESMVLEEADGVTTMTYALTFRDQAGRDHMSKTDGLQSSFDNLVEYVNALVDKH